MRACCPCCKHSMLGSDEAHPRTDVQIAVENKVNLALGPTQGIATSDHVSESFLDGTFNGVAPIDNANCARDVPNETAAMMALESTNRLDITLDGASKKLNHKVYGHRPSCHLVAMCDNSEAVRTVATGHGPGQPNSRKGSHYEGMEVAKAYSGEAITAPGLGLSNVSLASSLPVVDCNSGQPNHGVNKAIVILVRPHLTNLLSTLGLLR